MATTTVIPINSNSNDLAQYKGAIRKCPLCNIENKMNGRACKTCFDHGFIAVCTKCTGTGKENGKTVWDGGRNDHFTTCSACGGSGSFPAKKPANWDEVKEEQARVTATALNDSGTSNVVEPLVPAVT